MAEESKSEQSKSITPEAKATAVGLKAEVLAAYKSILLYQFAGTAFIVIVLAVWLLISYNTQGDGPPFLLLVVLAGIIGAFFSALIRLYNVDEFSMAIITPAVTQLGGRYLMAYSFVPPLVGAIAAVVLYLMFVAKLVEGSLFPTVKCATAACQSVKQLLNDVHPPTAPDYGKALVWAFIAGFSERLVPDMLQSLGAKRKKEE